MYGRLIKAPVDAQAVLLFLHASFTLASMQWAGQEGGHCIGTLASGTGAQLHVAIARHTLTQSPQSWATGLIARARVSCHQAVPAGQYNLQQSCQRGHQSRREGRVIRGFEMAAEM